MKVVGIDPAPKKGATIYDPTSGANEGWSTVDACNLPDHVSDLIDANSDVLVCWDSPLTAGQAGIGGCYYERPIERFFRISEGWVAPKGISVRAYAGCPHWAVTRATVGLPRVGRFDSAKLPLILCAEGKAPAARMGRYIVEVHPAVAIWLWCQSAESLPADWTYKKHADVRKTLWGVIASVSGDRKPRRDPCDDDEFDAYVAYLLGSKWSSGENVVLLGGEREGSFLVPEIKRLQDAFRDWFATGQNDAVAS